MPFFLDMGESTIEFTSQVQFHHTREGINPVGHGRCFDCRRKVDLPELLPRAAEAFKGLTLHPETLRSH